MDKGQSSNAQHRPWQSRQQSNGGYGKIETSQREQQPMKKIPSVKVLEEDGTSSENESQALEEQETHEDPEFSFISAFVVDVLRLEMHPEASKSRQLSLIAEPAPATTSPRTAC
jgi:hypothetical protein